MAMALPIRARSAARIDRPRLAAELSSAQIVAGRLSAAGDTVDSFTTRRMPPGALVPSVHAANITANDVVAAELQSALLSFGGNQRDVGIVVPDGAVRVGIFDFDEFPDDDEEARAVVRLRFRRNVPFDVEDAAISFHRLPAGLARTNDARTNDARGNDAKAAAAGAQERGGARPRVLAVAMPRTIL